MKRPKKFDRAIVSAEIRSILATGRQRILDLDGACDPIDRMHRDAMRMIDGRQTRSDDSER